MTEAAAAIIRAHGHTAKASALNAISNYGEGVGLVICRRMVWEILDTVREVHGAPHAVEMGYRAADAVTARDPVDYLGPEFLNAILAADTGFEFVEPEAPPADPSPAAKSGLQKALAWANDNFWWYGPAIMLAFVYWGAIR